MLHRLQRHTERQEQQRDARRGQGTQRLSAPGKRFTDEKGRHLIGKEEGGGGPRWMQLEEDCLPALS